MWIKKKVMTLIKKYKTNNPFEIAAELKIHVIKWDLHEEIRGFYKYDRRNRYIVINNNLQEQYQWVVCAHELGHAVLHKKVNTPFMGRSTFLSVNKIEHEANRFAAELLISDEDISEINNVYQIASLRGVPVELVKLKHFCREELF